MCMVYQHAVSPPQAEILTLLNDEYGFEYEQETPWQAVFAEAPQSPRHADNKAQASPAQHKTLADFLASADLADSDSSDSSFRCIADRLRFLIRHHPASVSMFLYRIFGAGWPLSFWNCLMRCSWASCEGGKCDYEVKAHSSATDVCSANAGRSGSVMRTEAAVKATQVVQLLKPQPATWPARTPGLVCTLCCHYAA
jgi:hypothetical protein